MKTQQTISSAKLPRLWFGHNLKNPIAFWKHFDGDYGLLLNAYHILLRPTVYKRFAENGIKTILDFKGKVFIDSGGFLFQMNREMDVSPEQIIKVYDDIHGDLKVILDQPLHPKVSLSSNKKRWVKTFTNTEIMLKYDPEMIPVLHGYTSRQIKARAREIKSIINNPKFIALGSLVPLFKGSYYGDYMKLNKTSRWEIIENVVKTVRDEFPDSFLHVFGAGSIKAINKLYEYGANSTDSVGWQIKAAFGEIITNNGKTRALKTVDELTSKRKSVFSESPELVQCQCPVCDGLDIKDQIRELASSHIKRAIHNSYKSYSLTTTEWKSNTLMEL
jgi:tRNA-guanine family transglycosylase